MAENANVAASVSERKVPPLSHARGHTFYEPALAGTFPVPKSDRFALLGRPCPGQSGIMEMNVGPPLAGGPLLDRNVARRQAPALHANRFRCSRARARFVCIDPTTAGLHPVPRELWKLSSSTAAPSPDACSSLCFPKMLLIQITQPRVGTVDADGGSLLGFVQILFSIATKVPGQIIQSHRQCQFQARYELYPRTHLPRPAFQQMPPMLPVRRQKMEM